MASSSASIYLIKVPNNDEDGSSKNKEADRDIVKVLLSIKITSGAALLLGHLVADESNLFQHIMSNTAQADKIFFLCLYNFIRIH